MKEEIAIICLKNHIPLIKMKIKMDSNCRYTHFYLIEILSISDMATPLEQQHIKIFFVFTYNTNYILGKEENIDRTQKRLEKILFKSFLFKQ